MKNYYILSMLLILAVASKLSAQDWTIDDPDLKAAITFDADHVNTGKELYLANCKSCHGDPGQNNGLASLVPPPPDILTDKVLQNSDGELFYKIMNGKGLMPQFSAVLGEDGVWNVIAFIRSLDEDYSQDASVAEEPQNISGGKAELDIDINYEEKKIYAKTFTLDENNTKVPLSGASIDFSVKRYFGNMSFAKGKTNDAGLAVIDFPDHMPGNSEGCVDLVASMGDAYSDVSVVVENAHICSPHFPVNLFEKRVMWSTNDKTQWWVILSYSLVVAGVWLTILYVVFQIVQISRLSKE